MKITENANGTFTLSDVTRPQLTRIALSIGVMSQEQIRREMRDYVKVTDDVADATKEWGLEYCDMLEALGIDVSIGYRGVDEEDAN